MKPVIKEDKAVSEIIGVILLFAIASVLLTSFILWYVPSTGTNNDLSYQSSTQNAFSSLDSKVLNPSLTPGSSVSQSFPLGISGTPPFTPSQSTNLYYSGSTDFNANLNYSTEIGYTNIIKTTNSSIAASANATASNILDNTYVDSQFQYSAIFEERNLSAGYYWTVTLGGVQESGSSQSSNVPDIISYSLARGTYSYEITTNNATERPDPSYGTVKVNGTQVVIPVYFLSSSASRNSNIVSENVGQINKYDTTDTINAPGPGGPGPAPGPGVNNVKPNYWLNNSAIQPAGNGINYYRLASQEFFNPYKSVVSYIEFCLEPNTEYGDQYYKGNSSIYIDIGSEPFSSAVSHAYENVTTTYTNSAPAPGPAPNTQSYFSNYERVKVSFKTPASLNSGEDYYINFWEAVNESKNYFKYNLSDRSPKAGCLYYSHTDKGYGYGPNEFIGTVSTPTTQINVGNSLSYTADIAEQGEAIGPGGPGPGQYTQFEVNSETESITNGGADNYFYVLGFSITSSSSQGCLFVKQKGLSSTFHDWNISINDKTYEILLSNSKYNCNETFTAEPIELPVGELNYSVIKEGNFVSNPESGFISITSGKTSYLNITFFPPIGTLPNYWAISKLGAESFTLDSFKGTHNYNTVNYLSVYLFNFTVPPGDFSSSSNLTNYVKLVFYNNSVSNHLYYTYIIKVTNTGYYSIPLYGNLSTKSAMKLGKGLYTIQLSDVNRTGSQSCSGTIGWGFTTIGGYDNYLQRDTSDLLSYLTPNVEDTSTVTPYNGGSPANTVSVMNQAYIFTVGYSNTTRHDQTLFYKITKNIKILGSINSNGLTQFTISESYVFQDGIVLTAGKGVTYVTVNPLPIRIVDNHKTGLSLSSIAYNISLQKGVSSSVSGTGSTIVSMTMTNSRSTNYTLGSSYIFNGTLGQVKCIKLDKYNYTIHSSYSKYWADTFFTEMNNEITGNSFSSFNIQNDFQFTMLNNKETVNISKPVDLYSLNIRYISFNVDSI